MFYFIDTVYNLLNKNIKNLIVFGIIFLFIEFIILFIPEIPIIFISVLFLFMGLSLLYLGWRIRKFQEHNYQYKFFINE